MSLALLVVDVLGDQLKVAEPLGCIRVAGCGGRLEFVGERLDGAGDVLKLGL